MHRVLPSGRLTAFASVRGQGVSPDQLRRRGGRRCHVAGWPHLIKFDIYAQRINSAGAVQWPVNGTAICTASDDQEYPAIASDGAGGAIVTWSDFRRYDFTSLDIYAQRVNAAGCRRMDNGRGRALHGAGGAIESGSSPPMARGGPLSLGVTYVIVMLITSMPSG